LPVAPTSRRPGFALVAHVFNRQTHHHGQDTALLSQLGHDFGVTDLPWTPGIDVT
jgi:uncharacterized damage-inducible protein DinB